MSQQPELFVPTQRYAVLVNNYDAPETMSIHAKGLGRVVELEAMLQGKFSPGNNIGEAEQRAFALQWEDELDFYQERGIDYSLVQRILPWDDIPAELSAATARIAAEATKESLTFLYVTSPGKHGSLRFHSGSPSDKDTLSYRQMVSYLRDIPGKKAIILAADYSGSLIDVVKREAHSKDYAVITSTSARQEARTGNDSDFDRAVTIMIGGARKLSALNVIPSPERQSKRQHAQRWLPFDVIL